MKPNLDLNLSFQLHYCILMNQSAEGFIACLVSSLLFGCMFVPLKRHDAGDGKL